ncbi:uncharacterized protein LOC9300567 isoform X2 [Arabidopsis lyrata subsp. lyrata]|uniref:uncharacterized protein LOC9300567 isoform X2 n=1 Tax=Arabidopsis lyrata subsp. lyrata TaxID=81972 RepID=UPI000A29DE63|nr:uncharacterized protein LOC9300567 isoform X2 [Arabidopsis lyrata subsp. lyrata]|eukprot:XP_020878528.1 uncharacterized protein LOC9300567 isoform X2 [Arabidopsis lyrata subsp. lyrata]
MAASGLTEYFSPPKKPKLDKASGESSSGSTYRKLRKYDPYDDEYIRQYILYYYQFHKSEYRTNAEVIRDVVCGAISQHNADTGTRLVFVDHVSASYRWCAGMLYWITFWARDLASSSPEPKLYQTNVLWCGPKVCEIQIFRPKPTDEEIAAVQVDPPPPLYDDVPELPTILFTVTGPGSGYMSIPEVSFTRIPAEVEPASSSKSTP